MDDSFEAWVRSEIERLRSEAQRCGMEADELQALLERWTESKSAASTAADASAGAKGAASDSAPPAPATSPPLAPSQTKKAYLVERVIEAGPAGTSRERLFTIAARRLDMNRDQARALLWELTKRDGLIVRRADQYFAGPAANR